MKGDQRFFLPNVFIPIGGTIVVKGRTYRCVKRPDVIPRNACMGCAFLGSHCPPRIQCTKSERSDNTFVWFEEVKDAQ